MVILPSFSTPRTSTQMGGHAHHAQPPPPPPIDEEQEQEQEREGMLVLGSWQGSSAYADDEEVDGAFYDAPAAAGDGDEDDDGMPGWEACDD